MDPQTEKKMATNPNEERYCQCCHVPKSERKQRQKHIRAALRVALKLEAETIDPVAEFDAVMTEQFWELA